MSTVPPWVTVLATAMVNVGSVVLVSLVTVTPEGFTTSSRSTDAGICDAPHMATTVVVVLPAMAFVVSPRKV